MYHSHFATARMAAAEKLLGGVKPLLFASLLKALYLIPMLYLWRSLADQGVLDEGYTIQMLLSYTCVSVLLGPLLNVQTPVSSWHYDGEIVNLCLRPQGLLSQLVFYTAGTWAPHLFLFVLPTAAVLIIFGISLLPATLWFFPSLMLAVSLGFAVDFLFACVVMRMKNAAWLTYSIRLAVTALLSGALIPFELLPFNLGAALRLSPFASLASGPLSVFVGAARPLDVLPLQLFWNALIWPLTLLAFKKSLEGMVSYGG